MSIPTPVVDAGNEHDDAPLSITNRDELRQAVYQEKMRKEDERKNRDDKQEMKETIDSGKRLLREIGSISQSVKKVFNDFDEATVGLLMGLSHAGCPFSMGRHIDIINCGSSFSSESSDPPGFFNVDDGRITLCHGYWKDRVADVPLLRGFLTRQLVTAFDNCKTDTSQLDEKSLLDFRVCSAVRSITLSGQCMYDNQSRLDRYKNDVSIQISSYNRNKYTADGFRECVIENSHKEVLEHAKGSFTEEEGEKSLGKVFLACFEDSRPFDRIPKSTEDFKLASKAMVEIHLKSQNK